MKDGCLKALLVREKSGTLSEREKNLLKDFRNEEPIPPRDYHNVWHVL